MVSLSVGAWAKNGSFGFAKGRVVGRARRDMRFVPRNKIELKKCAVGKIKNTEGSARSVADSLFYCNMICMLVTCQNGLRFSRLFVDVV